MLAVAEVVEAVADMLPEDEAVEEAVLAAAAEL